MSTVETDTERVVREEQHAFETEQSDGTAPETPEGKLFEVPRVKVIVDDTDPTVLKLAFSGTVELDRGSPRDVTFFNSLHDGRSADLEISVHVAGATTVHRRDKEGDVDAVVRTKSLTVTDVTVSE